MADENEERKMEENLVPEGEGSNVVDMNGKSDGTQTSPLAEAQAAAEKAKRDYLYLLAEFDNYKKSVIKERSDLRKYGSERLLVELLGVLDIFETALGAQITAENYAEFRKGVELTAHNLRSVLQRFGVEEVPAQGQPFDPTLHEALSSEETDSVPEGYVSQVFKKAYKLFERVIRPAQVVVAKPVRKDKESAE